MWRLLSFRLFSMVRPLQTSADSQIRQKEVSDMLSMISYAEERGEKKGEKKGIKKGENRLGMLMKILLDNKRYADAKRASEDETYREQLYKEFEI